MKQFHSHYSSNDERVLPFSPVPHSESKEKKFAGLKQYGLFARPEFYEFVFVQNSQPELLKYHNKAHVGKPNVPCILLCCVWLVYSIGGCRPRWLLSPEVELLRQVNSALLLWGNVISACEIYSIDLSTAYSRKNSIPVFDVMGV